MTHRVVIVMDIQHSAPSRLYSSTGSGKTYAATALIQAWADLLRSVGRTDFDLRLVVSVGLFEQASRALIQERARLLAWLRGDDLDLPADLGLPAPEPRRHGGLRLSPAGVAVARELQRMRLRFALHASPVSLSIHASAGHRHLRQLSGSHPHLDRRIARRGSRVARRAKRGLSHSAGRQRDDLAVTGCLPDRRMSSSRASPSGVPASWSTRPAITTLVTCPKVRSPRRMSIRQHAGSPIASANRATMPQLTWGRRQSQYSSQVAASLSLADFSSKRKISYCTRMSARV